MFLYEAISILDISKRYTDSDLNVYQLRIEPYGLRRNSYANSEKIDHMNTVKYESNFQKILLSIFSPTKSPLFVDMVKQCKKGTPSCIYENLIDKEIFPAYIFNFQWDSKTNSIPEDASYPLKIYQQCEALQMCDELTGGDVYESLSAFIKNIGDYVRPLNAEFSGILVGAGRQIKRTLRKKKRRKKRETNRTLNKLSNI